MNTIYSIRSNAPIPRGGFLVSLRFKLVEGVPVSYQEYRCSAYYGRPWDWDKIKEIDLPPSLTEGVSLENLSKLYHLLTD